MFTLYITFKQLFVNLVGTGFIALPVIHNISEKYIISE